MPAARYLFGACLQVTGRARTGATGMGFPEAGPSIWQGSVSAASPFESAQYKPHYRPGASFCDEPCKPADALQMSCPVPSLAFVLARRVLTQRCVGHSRRRWG